MAALDVDNVVLHALRIAGLVVVGRAAEIGEGAVEVEVREDEDVRRIAEVIGQAERGGVEAERIAGKVGAEARVAVAEDVAEAGRELERIVERDVLEVVPCGRGRAEEDDLGGAEFEAFLKIGADEDAMVG